MDGNLLDQNQNAKAYPSGQPDPQEHHFRLRRMQVDLAIVCTDVNKAHTRCSAVRQVNQGLLPSISNGWWQFQTPRLNGDQRNGSDPAGVALQYPVR
jgi:hypothetical protein